MNDLLIVTWLLFGMGFSSNWQQEPVIELDSDKPTIRVKAIDVPNDSGNGIIISWDDLSNFKVVSYEIFWSLDPQVIHTDTVKSQSNKSSLKNDAKKYWQSLATVGNKTDSKVFHNAQPGIAYYFKILAKGTQTTMTSNIVEGFSKAQWFDRSKLSILVLGGIICFSVIFFIQVARKGKKLFVRKIAGLEAIDEAIGRATEMGKPIVFVPGIGDLDNVQTLAGLTILGYVSETIAEYDAKLDVPVCRSLVMTTGREIVKQAYLTAGRPEAYNENIVRYLTDEQFGYVAGVNGTLLRDEPATCFYMGAFFAESLLLAETGNRIGAIQIAGTAMPSQLPFFVSACDYTLIGEELFAASAYLSRDPRQLGSLKGQDVGKLIVMVTIVIGSLTATVAAWTGNESFNWFVNYLKTQIFI